MKGHTTQCFRVGTTKVSARRTFNKLLLRSLVAFVTFTLRHSSQWLMLRDDDALLKVLSSRDFVCWRIKSVEEHEDVLCLARYSSRLTSNVCWPSCQTANKRKTLHCTAGTCLHTGESKNLDDPAFLSFSTKSIFRRQLDAWLHSKV